MGAIKKIVFHRWQLRGLVRYRVELAYDDQSSRVLEDVDYTTLIAEIGEETAAQIDKRKCDKGTIVLGEPKTSHRRAQGTRVQVEVVLRRDNPDEQAILAKIEEHPGYGKRTAFLCDWMVKGFLLLQQEAERLMSTNDPTRILDIFTTQSNYRLLSMYVEAQKQRQHQAASPAATLQHPDGAGQSTPRNDEQAQKLTAFG